ncbi:DNA cytosine methyltransferase [Swingsia samuiensis]|uniref:DNA (cytosine-5-)-methyltransferase n=1 Tax=Swingsia samuiensis TaxID=1293412 RepID=A0A4Y6UM07_9PROT|nr:DNA cytosine methyltransferase [Swingsia samuiensis]
MRVYYNEWDKPTAAWLSELGKRHHLPTGHIDTRSIRDVRPDDLRGYEQCHFFAGIGGWPCALKLAGYSELACWTGSPPCQPFSVAGRQKGQSDERHLAPIWLDLIKEHCPPIIFGEQVEAAIKHGWIDDLFNALESFGYACGAAVLPACSVGAPHLRKRLFFGAVRLADTNDDRCQSRRKIQHICTKQNFKYGDSISGVADPSSARWRQTGCNPQSNRKANGIGERNWGSDGCENDLFGRVEQSSRRSQDNTFWTNPDWIGCRDGKFRAVEPSTQPLADGIPARVGRLRGYGNAIVPQVAAIFIETFIASITESGELT